MAGVSHRTARRAHAKKSLLAVSSLPFFLLSLKTRVKFMNFDTLS